MRRYWPAVGLIAALALAGCSTGSTNAASVAANEPLQGGASASPEVTQPTLKVTPLAGKSDVRLDSPVQVKVTNGTLKNVEVVSENGHELKGSMNADVGYWRSSSILRSDSTYTVTVTMEDTTGETSSKTSSFTTLTPDSMATATITPGDNWTVGVGMPVVVDFSDSVDTDNRQEVEKALTVTTVPKTKGAWRWMSNTQIMWRPAKFWKSGTKVSVEADLPGVELASGVWGKRTTTSQFKIGSEMISTVDVDAHHLVLRKNGSVLRTIPVTTGMPGYLTRNGTKVIMSRDSKVRMDAASTGVSEDDPEYYNLMVDWAMRLTNSGEFIHAAPWSLASHGVANVSHGCTGMSNENARWLFDQSKVGDVVIYKNSPRKLEFGNGYTIWDKSFADWASGD